MVSAATASWAVSASVTIAHPRFVAPISLAAPARRSSAAIHRLHAHPLVRPYLSSTEASSLTCHYYTHLASATVLGLMADSAHLLERRTSAGKTSFAAYPGRHQKAYSPRTSTGAAAPALLVELHPQLWITFSHCALSITTVAEKSRKTQFTPMESRRRPPIPPWAQLLPT